MRIINLKQLCKEPVGTVFACIESNHESESELALRIKTNSFRYDDGSLHFNGTMWVNPVPENTSNYNGEELESEIFHYDGADHDLRDDGYNKFSVYNQNEIRMMIESLNYALSKQREFNIEKIR